MGKGFLFNTDRCVGCHACIIACSNQNGLDPGISWRSVFQFNIASFPAIPVFFHSLACQHCEEALCMIHCPANAFYRDPETNAVLVNRDKCIGCKYCTWACPFDAPEYNPVTKIIEKCTFCIDTVKAGDIPACAKCCPTGALDYGELDPSVPQDPVYVFSDYGIGPRIQFVARNKSERVPEMASDTKMKQEKTAYSTDELKQPVRRISFASEWSLALFTFLVPLIIGMYTAAVTSGHPVLTRLFLLSGIIGLLVSLFHLGKKQRFYRAVLNLKNSWLSREIFFFLLFLVTSVFTVVTGLTAFWLVASGIAMGFLTTFSIDRVYQLQTRTDNRQWHSSQTMLTAMLFVPLFMESFFPFIFVFAIKLALYIRRKVEFYRMGKNPRWTTTLVRILPGVISPVFVFVFSPHTGWMFALFSVALGELIDRIEFYLELDFVSPEMELHSRITKELQHSG